MKALFVYKDSATKWKFIPDVAAPYYEEAVFIPPRVNVCEEVDVPELLPIHTIRFIGTKCRNFIVYEEI